MIEGLWEFAPSDDETETELRLYRLFEGFKDLPGREVAIPSMFDLMERFPEAELGTPGPLVHELEAIAGYEPFLRDSIRRQPTDSSVWMVNRILNTELPSEQRALWLAELRAIPLHPSAPDRIKEEAEGFLEHQAKRDGV